MRGTGIVMGYTIRETVRKKVFLVTNIIFALVIIIAANIPNIIGVARNFGIGDSKLEPVTVTVDGETRTMEAPPLIFIDGAGLWEPERYLEYPGAMNGVGSELEAYKAQVATGDILGVVVMAEGESPFDFTYYHSGSFEGESGDIAEFLRGVKNSVLLEMVGLNDVMIEAVNAPFAATSVSVGGGGMLDSVGIASVLPVASSLFLFMMIFIYGAQVSAAIALEKTSRVMETLITSATPTAIVLGKTFANGILSLMQAGGLILVGVLSYHLFLPEEYRIFGMLMADAEVSPWLILVILVYFVLGYLLFSMLSAVVGATVNRVEDINSANAPLSILGVFSFYAAYISSAMPGTAFNVVVSLIPFTAPFSMPGRMLVSVVPVWQLALSVGLLAGAAAFVAYLSIRLYAALILHYGNRLKIKDLFALYRQK